MARRKSHRRRRRSGSLGSLGAVPLVLPIIGALTGGKLLAIAGVGAGAYILTRRGQQLPQGDQPIQKQNPCHGALLEQQLAASAAQTAAGGASAGAGGAAAGAGISLISNPKLVGCGLSAINRAKANLCRKADRVVAQIRGRGGVVPKGYDSLSCDQKVAFVAALGATAGLGLAVVLGGSLVGGLASASGQELTRLADRAKGSVRGFENAVSSTIENIGDTASNLAKKIGLGQYPVRGIEER